VAAAWRTEATSGLSISTKVGRPGQVSKSTTAASTSRPPKPRRPTCRPARSRADVGIPIYHRKRDSSEAHLTIVFAALAVSRWIENRTGWSIRKFIRTSRRHRTIEIQAGPRVITAVNPLPDDLRQVLDDIHRPAGPQ
jgi:hypothetical protein